MWIEACQVDELVMCDDSVRKCKINGKKRMRAPFYLGNYYRGILLLLLTR